MSAPDCIILSPDGDLILRTEVPPPFIPPPKPQTPRWQRGIPPFVDAQALAAYCALTWSRPVEPQAAAYFARLMVRRIQGFATYLPNNLKPITLNDIYRAAGIYFD